MKKMQWKSYHFCFIFLQSKYFSEQEVSAIKIFGPILLLNSSIFYILSITQEILTSYIFTKNF